MAGTAYVVVEGSPSDREDVDVPGTYEIAFTDDAPGHLFEEIALEVFHCRIGISTLDDFDISVVDAGGRPFEAQETGPFVRDREALEDYGDFHGKVLESELPFRSPLEAPGVS